MENRKLLGMQEYDYSIYAKDATIYGIVGFSGHLLFYVMLKFVFGYVEYTLIRLILACLFALFYFMPRRNWRMYHKVYFEAILYLSFPVFFSVMMFANGGSMFWATSYIFATMIYTIFAVEIVNMMAQASLLILVPLLVWCYDTPEPLVNSYLGIYLLSLLTIVLIVLFKTRIISDIKKQQVQNGLVKETNEMVSSLMYISSELAMYDDPDKVLTIFVERLSLIMELEGILLMLCRSKEKEIMYHAIRGLNQEDLVHIGENLQEIVRDESMVSLGKEAPMGLYYWQVFNKQFDLYNHEGKEGYNLVLALPKDTLEDYELGIFHLFFEQLSGNIRMRFMSGELERFANTDAMTKLFNRSAYKKAMVELGQGQEAYGLIFGDINGLKYVNDTYGHTDGDLMIRTCSDLISGQLPSYATAYRYGGDEIVVLVRNPSIEATESLIKDLEAIFQHQEILCTDEKTGDTGLETLAMSFGMIMSYEGQQEELLDLADLKMREQKDLYYKKKENQRYR